MPACQVSAIAARQPVLLTAWTSSRATVGQLHAQKKDLSLETKPRKNGSGSLRSAWGGGGGASSFEC